jgi:SecD/SecF fusion protein
MVRSASHADRLFGKRTVPSTLAKEPDKNVIKDAEGKREAWWAPVMEKQKGSFNFPSIAKRERTIDKKKVTEVLVIQDNYNVTNDYLDHAGPDMDQSGRLAINFTFNSQGGKLFGKLTGDNTPDETTGFKRQLGIILDGELYSAPSIIAPIYERGIIQGSFTKQ